MLLPFLIKQKQNVFFTAVLNLDIIRKYTTGFTKQLNEVNQVESN